MDGSITSELTIISLEHLTTELSIIDQVVLRPSEHLFQDTGQVILHLTKHSKVFQRHTKFEEPY